MDVIGHTAGGIANDLDHLADRTQSDQYLAANGQLFRGLDFFPELEFRWCPRLVGANQLFLTAADDLALVEEIDRIDDLVLEKSTDVDDVADTAAANQKGAGFQPRVGAVVADVARQAHCLAVIPARVHHSLNTLSSDTNELKPPSGLAWFWKTANTFSVIEFDSTKS